MTTLMTLSLVLQVVQLIAVCVLAVRYIKLRERKENQYYTDYVHNNLVLRVYKPEYEYQAIGDYTPQTILDRGRLSPFYDWALLDKRDLEKPK